SPFVFRSYNSSSTTHLFTLSLHDALPISIDRPTKKRLYEIFEDKNVELITTDKMVDDQSTNILVGTVDSEEFVDEYFKDNISYDDDFFYEFYPYILVIQY